MKFTGLSVAVISSLVLVGCSRDEAEGPAQAPPASAPGETGTAGEEVLLRYRFQAGDRFHFEMKLEMVAGGAGIEIPVAITNSMIRTVDTVDADGVATMTQKMQGVSFLGRYPQGTLAYDTASDDEEPVEHAAWPAIEPQIQLAGLREYSFKVDPLGNTSDFQFSPESLAQAKKMGQNPGLKGMIDMQDALMKQSNFCFYLPRLPQQPVPIGGSWDDEETDLVMYGAPGRRNYQFTLRSREDQNSEPSVLIAGTVKEDIDYPKDAQFKMVTKSMSYAGRFSLADGFFPSWVLNQERVTTFPIQTGVLAEESQKIKITYTMSRLPPEDAS